MQSRQAGSPKVTHTGPITTRKVPLDTLSELKSRRRKDLQLLDIERDAEPLEPDAPWRSRLESLLAFVEMRVLVGRDRGVRCVAP